MTLHLRLQLESAQADDVVKSKVRARALAARKVREASGDSLMSPP